MTKMTTNAGSLQRKLTALEETNGSSKHTRACISSPCSLGRLSPLFAKIDQAPHAIVELPIPWQGAADCASTCVVSIVADKTGASVVYNILDEIPWLRNFASPSDRVSESTSKPHDGYAELIEYRHDFIVAGEA